jgi:hypothetical protein
VIDTETTTPEAADPTALAPESPAQAARKGTAHKAASRRNHAPKRVAIGTRSSDRLRAKNKNDEEKAVAGKLTSSTPMIIAEC